MLAGLIGKLFGNDGDKQLKGSPRNIKHGTGDIAALLRLYQSENHLLTAIIESDQEKRPVKYSTGILMVEPRKRQFGTDEFIQREGNARLRPGVIVQFSLTHHGIRHQFECAWKGSTLEDGIPRHWFEFPKGIEQVQLRDAFRVKLSQAHPIKVALTHAEKPPCAGTVSDLSSTGLRMRVLGVIKPKPTRGEHFNSCHFVLGDGQPVVCEARLMHWQYDPDRDETFLGIRFEHVDGNTQRALNRYLTDLQRKQRHLT